MKFRDILAVAVLIIVAVVSGLMRGGDPPSYEDRDNNPRRPAPHQYGDGVWDAETRAWMAEAATPAPRSGYSRAIPREAVVEIPEDRGSGTGTAFAVGPGAWLTARHVVDGCDRIGLQIEERRGIQVTKVRNHPNADVSLLTTRDSPNAFAFGGGARNGDNAYMIGFPKGQPGAVNGQKIGETMLRERGRFNTRERTDVWAERSRIPDRFDSLGGLSGGPVFDESGRIIGVVLAEERRRGRIFTAQLPTLQTLMISGNVAPGGQSVGSLNATNYPREARSLILSLRVSKVICQVR